jgi:hypothetical protein
MKYKSESEFCKDTTKLIYADLLLQKIQVIPEVPKGSHIYHADILLINRTRQDMLMLEYKLSNWKNLAKQVKQSRESISYNFVKFGIINSKLPKLSWEEEKKMNFPFYNILPYTGTERELENILEKVRKTQWTNIHENDLGSIYWFGYQDDESSFDGGIQNGKRITLYQLYKKAVKNVLKAYPCLDFYGVYRILGFYSVSQAKKWYREALKELNQN